MHSFSKFWKTNEIWINQIKNTEMDTMMCDHRNNLYRQKQRTWTIIIKTEIEQISIGAKKKPTMTQSNEWDKMVFWICFQWILSTVIERTNCLNGVLENKLNGFCTSFEFKSNVLLSNITLKSGNYKLEKRNSKLCWLDVQLLNSSILKKNSLVDRYFCLRFRNKLHQNICSNLKFQLINYCLS